jgi:glutathione peroxidase
MLPDLPLIRNDGTADSLHAHAGNVLLVVNTASQCGLTPQYAGLEALQQQLAGRGFEVLAFPANDFGAQEPGTDTEIASFCEVNFGASFPLFAKASVVGDAKHPLYAALTAAIPTKQGDAEGFRERLRGHGLVPQEDPEVLWNFEKFLIGRDMEVIARFAPTTAPDDAALLAEIDRALDA